MSEIGHNGGTIKSFVERIERLAEERKGYTDDIREVYAEAKGSGFDVKALRIVVARRKMDRVKRDELDVLVDTYECGIFG